MKLAHYQLEHITRYINSQSICYTDIRHELTDHIASAVEHKMTDHGTSFAHAFSETIEEVNCAAIQKKKLINETLALWKNVSWSAFDLLKGYRVVMLLIAAAFCSLLFFSGLDPQSLDNWFSTGINVLIMIPVIGCLLDKKRKPYLQSYFMSSVVGLYLLVQLLVSTKTFLLDRLFEPTALIQTIYFTLLIFVILLGFHLIKDAYKKVKRYAIR